MNTTSTTQTRPQLETLACVNEGCESYGQVGGNNLTIRKNTGLWNTKVVEEKAVSVAEHLAEGCSLKATARLAQVHSSVITRLNRKVGRHDETFHDERMQGLEGVGAGG